MEIDNDALQFEQKMDMVTKLVAKFITRTAPIKIARIAEEHFKDNFEKQGFDDNGVEAWQPRNPDLDPGRAILVDTGALKNSIQGSVPQPGKIVVSTDVVYAKVHNEGNPDKNIPARKFIGNSKNLRHKIKKALIEDFKNNVKNKLS